MEVHVKAQFLASYTIKILANEKNFDPNIDAELTQRIKSCALDIYAKAWSANKIRLGQNDANRDMRYRLQQEAILACDDMHAYIGIAKQVYHIRSKRMKYWSDMISGVRALLQAWKESDAARCEES